MGTRKPHSIVGLLDSVQVEFAKAIGFAIYTRRASGDGEAYQGYIVGIEDYNDRLGSVRLVLDGSDRRRP